MDDLEDRLRDVLSDRAARVSRVVGDPRTVVERRYRQRLRNGRLVAISTPVVLAVLVVLAVVWNQQGRDPIAPAPPVSTATAPGTPTSSGSPAATVTGYFGALAGQDAGAARAELAPEYFAGSFTAETFAAWVANFRTLTDVTLRPARAPLADVPAQHPGYRDLTEVPVSYDATLVKPSGNQASGVTEQFVLVGRRGPGSPWLILDITSSP